MPVYTQRPRCSTKEPNTRRRTGATPWLRSTMTFAVATSISFRNSRSEDDLEQHEIEPAVELPPDLRQPPDLDEAEGAVQGHRDVVVCAETADQGVDPVGPGSLDDRNQ